LPHEAPLTMVTDTRRITPACATVVEIAGVTDVGRYRQRNEDAIDWDVKLGVAMVADGMGGNQGGDVASVTALRSIKDDLRRALADSQRHGERSRTRDVRGSLVVELVRRANQGVRKSAARDNRLSGMGTTLVMALAGPDFLTVAHVGDSRVYRLRDKNLERLTEDHTMVQELVERGEMDSRQAAMSRHRNVITRALGIAQDVMVDVGHHPIAPGDVFMLCSDGLTGMASDEDIAAALCDRLGNLEAAARNAVALANSRGGRDNISAVLMRIVETSHG
jgi:PPM family protein phosphatase